MSNRNETTKPLEFTLTLERPDMERARERIVQDQLIEILYNLVPESNKANLKIDLDGYKITGKSSRTLILLEYDARKKITLSYKG